MLRRGTTRAAGARHLHSRADCGPGAATPDATALVYQGRRMSYRGARRADQSAARHLISLASGPTCPWASSSSAFSLMRQRPRDAEGRGAYVPLDPNYPADRLVVQWPRRRDRHHSHRREPPASVPSSRALHRVPRSRRRGVRRALLVAVAPAAGPANLAYVNLPRGFDRPPEGRDDRAPQCRELGWRWTSRSTTMETRGTGWPSPPSLDSRSSSCWDDSRAVSRCCCIATPTGNRYVAAARPRLDFSLFYFPATRAKYAATNPGCCSRGPVSPTTTTSSGVDPERHFTRSAVCSRIPLRHQRGRGRDHQENQHTSWQGREPVALRVEIGRGMVDRRQSLSNGRPVSRSLPDGSPTISCSSRRLARARI